MSLFSYHLVKTSLLQSLTAVCLPPRRESVSGMIHAEWMHVMTLGAPVFSRSRILMTEIALFAQWGHETDLDHFLENDRRGHLLAKGWHARLAFMRQWGTFEGFDIPAQVPGADSWNGPVVAVTLARMKFTEIPRFIQWGRPTEQLVRDHPGTTMALASIQFPNTVSTFSVWKSRKEMTDMVHGHSKVPQPNRHLDAMKERNRKDFHFEFTTLRFRPLSESGV